MDNEKFDWTSRVDGEFVVNHSESIKDIEEEIYGHLISDELVGDPGFPEWFVELFRESLGSVIDWAVENEALIFSDSDSDGD